MTTRKRGSRGETEKEGRRKKKTPVEDEGEKERAGVRDRCGERVRVRDRYAESPREKDGRVERERRRGRRRTEMKGVRAGTERQETPARNSGHSAV